MVSRVHTQIPAGNGWLPQGGTVTQDFGVMEFIPSLGLDQPHLGIDVGASTGSPVTLPGGQSAHVTKAFYDNVYGGGNTVQLELQDGTIVDMFHLQDIAVKAGQTVNGGDLLGHVDSTGNSTGPHLHFQIMQGGAAVDPWHWLTGLGAATQPSSSGTGGSLNPFDAVKNVNDFFGHLVSPGHDPCSPPESELGVFRIIDALTCPQNWWKVLFVAIGSSMIVGGIIIYFFQEEKQEVQQAAPELAEVAAVL